MSQFEEEEDIPLSKYRKKSLRLKNDSDLIMAKRSQKKESSSPIINEELNTNDKRLFQKTKSGINESKSQDENKEEKRNDTKLIPIINSKVSHCFTE